MKFSSSWRRRGKTVRASENSHGHRSPRGGACVGSVRAVDGRIATMADSAWALFGSDDEGEAASGAGDDVDGTRSGGANKKRPRGEGSAVVGPDGDDVSSAWARDRASGPTTAANHAYFAPSRALWPADASLGAPADPRRADAALADFVAALAHDAAARVPSVAAQLRRHRPEGHAAADALVSTADAVGARDWRAAARAAVECQAAHSRQLDVGNWPHECWQRSHVFALGFQIAAELHAPTAHEGATTEGAASSSEFGALSENPAAAAGVRASAERWSPADRLGRVALEALAMAALATEPDEIPNWLGAGMLLAERACAAAAASARLSRGRRGFDARLPRGRRGFDARFPRGRRGFDARQRRPRRPRRVPHPGRAPARRARDRSVARGASRGGGYPHRRRVSRAVRRARSRRRARGVPDALARVGRRVRVARSPSARTRRRRGGTRRARGVRRVRRQTRDGGEHAGRLRARFSSPL